MCSWLIFFGKGAYFATDLLYKFAMISFLNITWQETKNFIQKDISASIWLEKGLIDNKVPLFFLLTYLHTHINLRRWAHQTLSNYWVWGAKQNWDIVNWKQQKNNSQGYKSNYKKTNIRDHGFIELYFKKVFPQPFLFQEENLQ